jgi:hypothetical protein
MFRRLRAHGFIGPIKAVVLAVVVVSVPLLMIQPAEAAGTFTPMGGNQVQINFTSSNDPGSTAWFFLFSGANVLGGSCPSGGTFMTIAVNPNEAECSFGAAATAGQVTVTLDAPYSCTATVQDSTSSPASGNIQEAPITCSAEQTTTTTTSSTTTTSTTTTTQPSVTTTSTLPLGPCKCKVFFVSVSPKTVTIGHVSSASAIGATTRLSFRVSWTLTCTQGLGHCTALAVIKSPTGDTTTLLPSVTSGGGAKIVNLRKSRTLKPLTFRCSAPCGAKSSGVFYLQTQSKTSLVSKTLTYTFVTTCSGGTHSEPITLVFGTNGRLDLHKSSLGFGKGGSKGG